MDKIILLDDQREILERQLLKLRQGITGWAYGYRRHPITGVAQLHNGVDLPAVEGTPIHAPSFGTVSTLWTDDKYGGGNSLVLTHTAGPWVRTGYAHLHGYAKGLKVGDTVVEGQVIAYVGTTGKSTGPHLHFTARAVDKVGNAVLVDPLGILCASVGIVELPEPHQVG